MGGGATGVPGGAVLPRSAHAGHAVLLHPHLGCAGHPLALCLERMVHRPAGQSPAHARGSLGERREHAALRAPCLRTCTPGRQSSPLPWNRHCFFGRRCPCHPWNRRRFFGREGACFGDGLCRRGMGHCPCPVDRPFPGPFRDTQVPVAESLAEISRSKSRREISAKC